MFRAVRDEVMTETKREQQPLRLWFTLERSDLSQATRSSAVLHRDSIDGRKASYRARGNEARSEDPRDSLKRNLFSPEDAQRVAAIGMDQKLKVPPFAIGETKSDVPDSYLQFVGVWSNKTGFGGGTGRHVMLIVTEVTF